MADFFDKEAIESDNSDEEDYGENKRKSKEKKHKKKPASDDEEEEDDDDERAAMEMKDLINDEEEEEEVDSDDDINRKRKHDEDEELEDDLEEDDYALLEENLGVRLNRKKKLKRVKRIVDAESDDEVENNEEDAREAIERELFDDDDNNDVQQNQRPQAKDRLDDRYGQISGSEESEDEDNFIVDEDDRPIPKPRRRKGHRCTDEALQQAQDVFGVDFDFEDFDQMGEEGYEDEEEEEEEEYEETGEEGGETMRVRKKGKSKRRQSRKSIFEIYEPSELERSHLTEIDNEIRNADIPERFQLRSIPVTNTNDAEIEEEADWIFTNAFTIPTISHQNENLSEMERQPAAGSKNTTAIPKIKEALRFIRNSFFEVPFIAFYRKEYVVPDLTIDNLWTIYKYDEKWCRLQQKKANLLKLFKNMQQYQCDQIMKDPDAPLPEGTRLINDPDIDRVTAANSFEDLHDCWVQFQVYYATELPGMKQEMLRKERERRLEELTEEDAEKAMQEEEDAINLKLTSLRLAQRKDVYTICKENGILGVASKFGLTPEQFGENVRDNYVKHEVEQYPIDPIEVAQDYITPRYPTTEAVLRASRFMVAKQISSDPLVRHCVRKEFFERAKLHVKPTKKGIKEIDESHPLDTFKYLRNKPVRDLFGEQFLQLVIGEKEKLVTIRITIDEEFLSEPEKKPTKYFDELKNFYHRDEFSILVQQWNDQRAQALELALKEFLYPAFEKEMKTKLLQEAEETVIKSCSRKLQDWLKVAPYQPDASVSEDEDFDIRDGVRVMGFAFVPSDDNPAFGIIVDGDGEILDHVRLPYFMLKRSSFATQQEKEYREKDKQKLKQFIMKRKPHVICVGAETMMTRYVIEDITAILTELVEMEQFPQIPVELVDNELATVYMNTKRAISEFHDFPPLLRQAVSIARRMQDPLIEFSQLCSSDEEILCIKYHPLQSHVSKDSLLNNLYLEFINRVNEVGVDVNRALVHPYTAPLVQFICGLGPRKSASLLRTLKKQQTPLLESRTQLVMNCQIGKTVFINCAGFIKIDTAQLNDTGTDTYIEVLDSTRVHPEAYEWARKMAVDALEYDDDNDANPGSALEEILENPEKLKDLDLDAFAEELERQGFGDKHITLYDIRAELNHRYKDLRSIYIPPGAEEIFHLLTRETPDTFYIGKLVLGPVIGIARKKPQSEQLDGANPIRSDETGLWQCPFCKKGDFSELSEVWAHFDSENCPGEPVGVRVRLDNGVIGFVENKNLSDKPVTDPSERVQVGMTIHARILKINIEKFIVDLTCKTSDLSDKEHKHRSEKDYAYDFEMEDRDMKVEEDTKKKQNRPNYIKRIIVHESFHNVDFTQAERLLQTMDQGEAIIRPSSKGSDHLTLTWKVAENINQHVDIKEEGKDNAFSLGHQLFINNEAYEDLDEIIARYVHPMATHARELINFKYYRPADCGKKEAMERMLLEEKKKYPSKSHYFIAASKEYPGKFILSYIPSKKVFHEYITVTPKGFRYRKNDFRSVNSMISWFKEHFRDPIPQTPKDTTVNRTPLGQSSQIASDSTPIINQAIHRAVANMPSHIFNNLTQIANQTPSFAASGSMTTPFGQSNFFPQQTPQPAQTPLISPYVGSGNNSITTPRNFSNNSQNNSWESNQMRPPTRPAPRTAPQNQNNRPKSRSGTDWATQAEPWNRKKAIQPRTPLYATPGASSQMSISPNSSPNYNKGDQTPLVDEWT